MFSFFANLTEDGSYALTMPGYTALVVLMLALLLAGSFFFGRDLRLGTKQLAFSSMAVALAMVTSMIKLFKAPMGGSVTLFSMLFIVLIGHWWGLSAGLAASLAYGVLQLIIDPYILSLPQLFVDYIFAFGALGLSGLFTKTDLEIAGRKIPGLFASYLVAVFGRFLFATLSGIIFFASYAPEGWNPLVYSICYNGSYLLVESVLTLVAVALPPVRKALGIVRNMALSQDPQAAAALGTDK